jgi:hypothetical protein
VPVFEIVQGAPCSHEWLQKYIIRTTLLLLSSWRYGVLELACHLSGFVSSYASFVCSNLRVWSGDYCSYIIVYYAASNNNCWRSAHLNSMNSARSETYQHLLAVSSSLICPLCLHVINSAVCIAIGFTISLILSLIVSVCWDVI